MTPIQIATLEFVAEHQTVDLREISEPMRQRIIDLGMMEPALICVDGPRAFLSGHGYGKMHEWRSL